MLPCATCLAESFQERLKEWIRGGGRAVAIAPPGVYGPWGRPSGKLLSEVFPGVEWTSSQPGQWETRGAVLSKEAAHPLLGDLCRGRLGKGELLVFTKVQSNTRPAAEPALLAVLRELMPHRPFYATSPCFELTLRHDEKQRRYVLTVLNSDLHAPAEGEVRLRMSLRQAVDVEIGMDLPVRREGDESVLRLTLSPAEGVLIELRE
ncbi:MAG: hypothetical protein HUU20_04030 [Pirellulales bacterium]|nr:hypothetical protein [Pirellulales bacterium]